MNFSFFLNFLIFLNFSNFLVFSILKLSKLILKISIFLKKVKFLNFKMWLILDQYCIIMLHIPYHNATIATKHILQHTLPLYNLHCSPLRPILTSSKVSNNLHFLDNFMSTIRTLSLWWSYFPLDSPNPLTNMTIYVPWA